MAQKVQTLYIDDIDGSEAAGTVRFGLDGTDYEIDLNAAHTDELHAALGTSIGHARKVGGTSRRAPRGRRSASAMDTTAVRLWAREPGTTSKTAAACRQHGHQVPRGNRAISIPLTRALPASVNTVRNPSADTAGRDGKAYCHDG